MKTLLIAFRCLLILTILTGAAYPLAVTIFAKTFFPKQASGSLVYGEDGKILGSELLAQGFKSDRYFWSRPSAVDYNPLPSGGSNLGPTSKALKEAWEARRKLGAKREMLAASASGLDPEISPESALAQVTRVARARGKPEEDVRNLVTRSVERRQLGFLGEPRVNVLRLNLSLDGGAP